MDHLEPNVIALSWFVLLWSVCCLSFFQLAGMYPLRSSGGGRGRNPALLVLGNTAIWLALLASTLTFAFTELRWTTIIVVAGILFLFIPGVFQVIPARVRDGRAGLAVASGVMIVLLAALVSIGAPHL